MSRLSRFLPKFLRGGKDGKQTSDKSQCKIIFLDETEYFIPYKLNLLEKDYFGLRFIDGTGQTHWLDVNKTLSSQLKGCTIPYTFYFGVKFYPADPCKLREEITRYQFFLQVKRDILHGRLPVSFEEAAELFTFAVQSELGDYDSQDLPPGYVSEFQFVPNQTEALEEHITQLHRRLGGTLPATAELKFLDKVKWLDMYGVDLHPVMGEGNTEYFLGLTPTGIVVYKNKTKVGNYFWPRITKVNFKGKVFIVRVKDKINDEHTYAFELATKQACKHLWRCCVEHHAFFSGRTEREHSGEQQGRDQPRVIRVQSRRQARRAMSDSRLNHDHSTTGIQFTEGHVTMVVKPEQVKGPRHRSLPDLKGRESPTSTRSAPWETNMDTGLYTSGRESPVSVTQSENVNQLRRYHRDSDSEAGHRRKYFPSSRKGSDNESDVSVTRRKRRDHDSGSESDISPNVRDRYRKARSVGPDRFEREWNDAVQGLYMQDKENRPVMSASSVHSAPLGEARQKKMRRRRSKSPGNGKRPPEELRQHIAFDMVEPSQELTEDQLREIPYVNVDDLEGGVKVSGGGEEQAPPPYSHTLEQTPEPQHRQPTERTPEPRHRQPTEQTQEPRNRQPTERQGPGFYSDTGSLPRRAPPAYSQQQFNNTLPSKHFTADIRSVPQFHENALFYEPNMSPRYQVFKNPMVHHYHPPPTAVFKPIDNTDGRGSTATDHSQTNRNHDSGLNSSQSSGGPGYLPQSQVRGPIGRMFGTQDAIARLYSSPGAGRRSNNQSEQPANQSSPYNRGVAVTANPQHPYNMHAGSADRPLVNGQTSSQAVNYNSSNASGYPVNSRSQAQYSGFNQNRMNLVQSPQEAAIQPRGQQQNGYINQSHYHHSNNQSGLEMDSNRTFFSQNDSHQGGSNQRSNFAQQNTLQANTHQSYPAQDADFRPKTNQYNDFLPNGTSPSRQDGRPQTSAGRVYSPATGHGSQYGPTADNRLGLQPSWQYVGNGGVNGGVPQEPANQKTVHHGQQPLKPSGSVSPYSQSPSSSPVKTGNPHSLQGTRPLASQIHSKSHINSPVKSRNNPGSGVSSPSMQNRRTVSVNQTNTQGHMPQQRSPMKVKSPDSAISSLNSMSVTGSARSSPQKQTPLGAKLDPNIGNNNVLSQKNNMGGADCIRARTPAFGQSESQFCKIDADYL
ncbi:E41LA-like protein [Mya arenaria]|uniref:E41LA-like protein n=1 Tax=Mya arenaria TaxID=6604 RepID=A0ABY7DT15_MYAAR|nr:E41LA-like protein [Mya arenaria]